MATPAPNFRDFRAGTPAAPASDSGELNPSNVDQLAALSGLLSGLESTRITATGQAEASRITAQGADAEIAAYETAGEISDENAKIAGIAGEISVLQQQRQVAAVAGQQQAAAGAGGVMTAGSVLDVMQSSYQQGAVATQLLQAQTALEQGGFAAQAAATDAEVAAARTQQAAALAEADAYTAQASQAASQTAQLQGLYGEQIATLENLEANPTDNAAPDTTSPTSQSFREYRAGGGNRAFHYNFGNLGG